MWASMPLCCIAQNNWDLLMQPSNIVQHKTAQSNPFIHHSASGGLAFTEHGSIGVSVENRYLIASLSKLNISTQYKTENGGIGLHLNALANEIFNGASMGAGYGVRLSKTLGIGIGGGVRRDQFRGFTPLFILSPQLGLLYLLTKKGSISINLRKLIKPLASPTYNEFGTISTAFNFQITSAVQMGIELENNFRSKSNMNLYTEWSPSQQLESYVYYRTGSAEIQSGLLFIPKRWKMGIGISHHPMLGSSCFLMIYHVLQ